MTPVAQEVSCTNRISVFSWPSIERVHVKLAWPAPSIATCWKSSSSRSSEQPVPPVQIGPVLTTVGSTVAGAEKVAPPSALSRYCSNHWTPSGAVSGVATAPSVWYSETATLPPLGVQWFEQYLRSEERRVG